MSNTQRSYDENPYDNVTLTEALHQLYERLNDRTIRQAFFVMKEHLGESDSSGGNSSGGRGISSISFKSSSLGGEAGQAGATDTYEIKYSDNTSDTFVVYNGTNGESGEYQKGEVLEVTLKATDWISSKIEIASDKILENSIVAVSLTSNITIEELDAVLAAKIIGSAQENGKIVLEALGAIPTIDIRILLYIE